MDAPGRALEKSSCYVGKCSLTFLLVYFLIALFWLVFVSVFAEVFL